MASQPFPLCGLLALCVTLLVVIVRLVAVPRAVATDPGRRGVEAAARATLCRRCARHMSRRRCGDVVHFRSVPRIAHSSSSTLRSFLPAVGCLWIPNAKNRFPMGSGSSTSGLCQSVRYVETTSDADSFGMPQTCTSDMATRDCPSRLVACVDRASPSHISWRCFITTKYTRHRSATRTDPTLLFESSSPRHMSGRHRGSPTARRRSTAVSNSGGPPTSRFSPQAMEQPTAGPPSRQPELGTF